MFTFSLTLLKKAEPSFFIVDVHSLYCCFSLDPDCTEYRNVSISNSSEKPRPLFNIASLSSMNCKDRASSRLSFIWCETSTLPAGRSADAASPWGTAGMRLASSRWTSPGRRWSFGPLGSWVRPDIRRLIEPEHAGKLATRRHPIGPTYFSIVVSETWSRS